MALQEKYMTENLYYRDDSRNIPYKHDGTPLQGGPWLRIGSINEKASWQYCHNAAAGMIALACPTPDCKEGQVAHFLGRNTDLNHQILKEAGFKHSYANLHIPPIKELDQAGGQAKKFLQENLRAEDTQQNLSSHGIKITGQKYTKKGSAEVNMIDPLKESRFLESYNYNHGVLVFVDQNGEQYLATGTAEGMQAELEKLGFCRNRNLPVPFSHGESLVYDKASLGDCELAARIAALQNAHAYIYKARGSAAIAI
jgi:hypothetical protein